MSTDVRNGSAGGGIGGHSDIVVGFWLAAWINR
jgi:hypothetical protein